MAGEEEEEKEETSQTVTEVGRGPSDGILQLRPQLYLGVSPQVSGCGVFLEELTFSHISGRLVISEDLRTRRQTYFHLPKYRVNSLINAVAFDRKRTVMAVAEEGCPPLLNVYSLKNYELLVSFSPPEEQVEAGASCTRFSSLFVHADSDRVTGLLDQTIYTLSLVSASLEAVTPALKPSQHPPDTQISQIVGHPEDTFHYAVLGIGLLRFMTWMGDIWEDVFHSFSSARGLAITCGTYTSLDNLLVGTADGKLFLIAYEGIRAVYDPLSLRTIHIHLKKKGVAMAPTLAPPEGDVARDGFLRQNEVKLMQSFRRGLLYVVAGSGEEIVQVLLKGRFRSSTGETEDSWIPDLSYNPPSEEDSHKIHGFKKIYVGSVEEYKYVSPKNRALYDITNVAINPSGTCIILTFTGRFFMILDVKDDFVPPKRLPSAQMLNVGYNKCPMEHIAACAWKSMFLTASERALKMYDYSMKEAYLVYTFQEDVLSLTLHPSGYMALVGLSEKAILFGLQEGTLLPIVEVATECCRYSVFSDDGHLMLLASQSSLSLYTLHSFQLISQIIDEQAGKISGLKLCSKNNHVWTCRTSGLVTQTNLRDGLVKYLFGGASQATSFDEMDNFKLIYLTGFDGTIEELDIPERTVRTKVELGHGQLTEVIVCKRWSVLVVGAQTGYILLLRCPFGSSTTPLLAQRLHYAPIVKIALSVDGSHLLSSAADGSVCLSKLEEVVASCPPRSRPLSLSYAVSSSVALLPASYRTNFDPRPVQSLVHLQQNYFSQQEKLMLRNPKKNVLKDLESLLDCLKSYELRGVLHPRTKLARFKESSYWAQLSRSGRDHLLSEQQDWELALTQFYTLSRQHLNVYQYFDEKSEEYRCVYLSRLQQSYEMIKANSKYLSGVIFHDVTDGVVEQLRAVRKFCRHYKAQSNEILAEIERKGRHLNELRSHPRYLRSVRKERHLRYQAITFMKTVLHRKILKLLIVFRGMVEAGRLCSVRLQEREGGGGGLSGGGRRDPAQEGGEEEGAVADSSSSHGPSLLPRPYSPIHSEDPSDSVNVDFTYLAQYSAASSCATQNCLDKTKVIWPKQTKKCKQFINDIKKNRKIHMKKKNNALEETGCSLKTTERGGEENVGMGLEEEEEDEDEGDVSQPLLGNTFIIKNIEGKLKKIKIIFPKSNKTYLKRRMFHKLHSKVSSLHKKLISIEDGVREWSWKPETVSAVPPRTVALYNGTYAYLMSEISRKISASVIQKKREMKYPSVKPVIFDECPKMFDHFMNIEKFVEKMSIFNVLKSRLVNGKFREALLNFSPNSKLNLLAVKHLVLSKYFLSKSSRAYQPLYKGNILSRKRNALDYDPFSDFEPTTRRSSSKRSSQLDFNTLTSTSRPILEQSLHLRLTHGRDRTHRKLPPFESNIRGTTISNLHNFYRKIKYCKDWERLCQLAYPLEDKPCGIDLSVPSSDYEEIFQRIFSRNLQLPRSGLPILKKLMMWNSHLSKCHSRTPQERSGAIFPLREIWILHGIHAIKHLRLPQDHITGKMKPIKVLGHREKILRLPSDEVSSDVFVKEDIKRSFIRTGTVEQLNEERLKYNIIDRDKWLLFDPPISKNLMSVLIENDLLYGLERCSDRSISRISCYSDDKSGFEADFAPFDEREVNLRPSDTDIWKDYFLSKDKDIIELEKDLRAQTALAALQRKCPAIDEVKRRDVSWESELTPGDASRSTIEELKDLTPKEEKSDESSSFDFYQLDDSAEDIRLRFLENLKKYELYYTDKSLFPLGVSSLPLADPVDPPEPILPLTPASPTNQAPKENVPKDGPMKRNNKKKTKSCDQTIQNTKTALTNIPDTVSRQQIIKVKEWLDKSKNVLDRNGNHKLKNKSATGSFRKPISVEIMSEPRRRADGFKLDGSVIVEDGSKKRNLDFPLQGLWDEEKERKLWERLYKITFDKSHEVPLWSSPSDSYYYDKLWRKLFKQKQPKTVESFEMLDSTEQEAAFKTGPKNNSFDKMYKDCLPLDKHPEDPSDEILTVSSLKYVVFEDKYTNRLSCHKYSIYSKQRMTVKTHLKGKVWFVPHEEDINDCETVPGKFYYPGQPWHKGIMSSFLLRSSHQNTATNIKTPGLHKSYTSNVGYANSLFSRRKEKGVLEGNKYLSRDGIYESLPYKKLVLPFGPVFLLPVGKVRGLWKSVAERLGRGLATQLLTALNKKIPRGRGASPKTLVVSYNRALLGLSTAFPPLSSSGPVQEPSGLQSSNSGQSSSSILLPPSSEELPDSSDRQTSQISTNEARNAHMDSCHRMSNSQISLETTTFPTSGKLKSNFRLYEKSLEWGLYKNYLRKINHPRVYLTVKHFEEELFKWIKKHLKVKKNVPPLVEAWKERNAEIVGQRGGRIKPTLQIEWPDRLTKRKKYRGRKVDMKKTKYQLEGGLECPKSSLLRANRRILDYGGQHALELALRSLQSISTSIPTANRVKTSPDSRVAAWLSLEWNPKLLRRLRESMMAKKLRRLHNYCKYRSKYRREFHEYNQLHAFHSPREAAYRQQLAKTEEFHKEYYRHRCQLLLWTENIETIEVKLNSALKVAEKKWKHLENTKSGLLTLMKDFKGGNEKITKEAVFEFLKKYVSVGLNKEKLRTASDYNRIVVNSMKSQGVDDVIRQERSHPHLWADQRTTEPSSLNSLTSFPGGMKTVLSGKGTSYDEQKGDEFYTNMALMSVKLKRQEESLKRFHQIMKRQKYSFINNS